MGHLHTWHERAETVEPGLDSWVLAKPLGGSLYAKRVHTLCANPVCGAIHHLGILNIGASSYRFSTMTSNDFNDIDRIVPLSVTKITLLFSRYQHANDTELVRENA